MLHTMAGPSFADQPQEHEPAGNGADYAVLDQNYEVLRRESGPVAQANAMDPVLKNLLDSTKAGFIRFSTTKLVDNPALNDSFERYLAKLKEQGANTSCTYGFIQLPNGERGEEEDLCRYGVRSGMNYHGELGDAYKGVYLSRYADVCTPSALLNGQNLRVLVCKVLLGKTKMVAPDWKHKTTLAPDPDFHSHISALPEKNPNLLAFPPVQRYKHSLMYVYEYLEDGTTSHRPTMILPLSVVEYQCNKPGSDLLNVLLPRVPSSVVWTGTLSLQKHSVKGVTMHSHFATNIGRPRGMDLLTFKVFVPFDTVIAAPPISRLAQEDTCGSLVLVPEAIIPDVKQAMYVQYFVLKCDESEAFDELCTLMRRFELVGVNRLASGTQMFLVPNGGLSAKLGFFLYNTSVFHCIVASPRSARNANNLLRPDPYERRIEETPKADIVDLRAAMANLFKAQEPPAKESNQEPEAATLATNHSQPPPPEQPSVESPAPEPMEVAPVQPKAPEASAVKPLEEKPLEEKPAGAPEEAKKKTVQLTVTSLGSTPPARPPLAARPGPSKPPVTTKLVYHPPPAESRSFRALVQEDTRYATTSSIIGLPRRALQSSASQPPERVFQKPRFANPLPPTARIEPPKVTTSSLPTPPPPQIPKIVPMQVETPKLLPTASVQRLEQESFQKARDQLRAKRPEESEQPPSKIAKTTENPEIARNKINALLEGRWFDDVPEKTNGAAAGGQRSRTASANESGGQIEEATNNSVPPPPRAPAPIVTRFGVVDPIVVRGNAHNDTARPFESPDRSSPNWTLNRSNPTGDSSFTAGGLGLLSSKDEIWVVLDPELFLSPVFQPPHLELLFELFNNLNGRLRARVLRFKWHECIRQGLEKQANEAPVGSFLKTRAAQFNRLVTVESGRLIDAMPQHLCDHPQRSAKKYLICCMNLQRQRPHARFIFLSTVITPLADAGPNFLANKIELYDPDEFTRDLESV